MADKEKDVPIKEQDDGSVLAKVEAPEGFDDEEQEELKEGGSVETADDSDEEDHQDSDQDSDQDDGESEDERERIREARREERRLKKELQKQREVSAKHKISALEKRNEELARRLAAVENTAASYQFAQIDKALEDEATRVEYAKMKMLQAAQNNNAAEQMEYLEQLTDAKQRLAQVQAYKKQQLEQAKAPKQNVPNELSAEVQRNAERWLKRNSWFDTQARDTDSRIAKVVDQELAADGWDPSDSEYWEELDNRLQSRLPHRYTAKGSSKNKRSAGPTASSRVANETSTKPGTITLSRERVQAIKDAGAWDDVEKRNKMIRAYASYDRSNRG
jgi:DNA repair exonuclease SbcCD ATPase subunit